MVHDDTTYLDDEGLAYVVPGGEDEESGTIMPVRVTTGWSDPQTTRSQPKLSITCSTKGFRSSTVQSGPA